MKEILLNGEIRTVSAETVSALVDELGLAAPMVLVEHNGLALRRSEWPHAVLNGSDRIEILRVSAGG